MAIYHGISVNFGLSSSINTVSGAFQTRDHQYTSGNEIIANGQGDPVEKTYYGQIETATFEYVATNTGGPSGTAAVLIPAQGQTATVVDVLYSQISGSTWLVDKASTKGSNTTAVRVTVDLWRASLITS
jgi:hypothetical protein